VVGQTTGRWSAETRLKAIEWNLLRRDDRKFNQKNARYTLLLVKALAKRSKTGSFCCSPKMLAEKSNKPHPKAQNSPRTTERNKLHARIK
jgi:hypothetical protein